MTSNLIGIFSGTFDPIHLGHIHLAQTVYELCKLKKIYLIPCYRSPVRTQPTASALDRFNMVKIATSKFPYLIADDREIKQPTTSYSINTLESFRRENADIPLALIMGIDAFNKFDEWLDFSKILKLVHLIITNRPSERLTNPKIIDLVAKHTATNLLQLHEQPSGLIYTVDINPLPIAATKIRSLISTHQDINHLISLDVLEYIDKHRLYL